MGHETKLTKNFIFQTESITLHLGCFMDEMDGKGPASNRLPLDGEAEERQDEGPAAAASSAAPQSPAAVHADEFEEPEGGAAGVQHADALDFEEEEEALDPVKIEQYQRALWLVPALGIHRGDGLPSGIHDFLLRPDTDSRYVRAALSKFKEEHLQRGYTGGMRLIRNALSRSKAVARFFNGGPDNVTEDERYRLIFGRAERTGHISGLAPLAVEKLRAGTLEVPESTRAALSFHYLDRIKPSDEDKTATSLFRSLTTRDILSDYLEGMFSITTKTTKLRRMNIFLSHADEETVKKVMVYAGPENFLDAVLPRYLIDSRWSNWTNEITQILNNHTRLVDLLLNSKDSEFRIQGLRALFTNSFWQCEEHNIVELSQYRADTFRTIFTKLIHSGKTDELVKLLSDKYLGSDRSGWFSPLDGMLEDEGSLLNEELCSCLLSEEGNKVLSALFASEPQLVHTFVNYVKSVEWGTERIYPRLQTMVYELEDSADLTNLEAAGAIREALEEEGIDLESIARPPVATAVHADEPEADDLGEARDVTERAILQDKEISEKERVNRLLEYRARPHITDEAEVAPAASAAAEPAKESDLAHLDFEDVPEGRALNWAISRILRASFEHSDDNKALYSSLHADLATLVRHGETRAADYVANYLYNTFNALYRRDISPETLLIHLYWEAGTAEDDDLATGVQSMLGGRLSQLENEEAEHYLYMDDTEFGDAKKSGEMTQSIKNEMLRQAEMRYKTVAEQRVAKTELDTKVAYFERLIEAYNEPQRELTRLQLLLESERKNPATDERVNRVHHLESEIEAMKEEVEEINEARSDAMAAGSPPAWRAKIAKLQAEFKKIYLTKRLRRLERLWVSRGAKPVD